MTFVNIINQWLGVCENGPLSGWDIFVLDAIHCLDKSVYQISEAGSVSVPNQNDNVCGPLDYLSILIRNAFI
jgi:hypothetical protein